MKMLLAPSLLSLFTLSPAAQERVQPRIAHLESYTLEHDGQALACARIDRASGNLFVLLGSFTEPGEFDLGQAFVVGWAPLDAQGSGRLRVPYPREIFGPGATLELCAAHPRSARPGAPWVLSEGSTLRLTGSDECEELDVDHRPGLDVMNKGEVVTDQFASIGLLISALNARAGGPDKAIIFDPAQDTTNADPDLHTPFGKLLIIAENDFDGDADGRVDVPDDEASGGDIVFDFTDPVDLQTLTVVDIDDSRPSRVHLDHAGGGTTSVDLVNLGDGSVQELELAIFALDVVRMTVELGGSGGIPSMSFSPCPLRFDLDETPAGVPVVTRRAGETITDQYACLGLNISAVNNNAAHPDKAILFDSSAPTGGDTDLATPGSGPGNDRALGLLLVLAENDTDGDGDGLVDDPDDEAFGGELVFDFVQDVRWLGATVVDIDDPQPTSFELLDSSSNLLQSIPVPNGGDNSVVRIELGTPVEDVRRVVLRLGGSGGLAEMVFCPTGE